MLEPRLCACFMVMCIGRDSSSNLKGLKKALKISHNIYIFHFYVWNISYKNVNILCIYFVNVYMCVCTVLTSVNKHLFCVRLIDLTSLHNTYYFTYIYLWKIIKACFPSVIDWINMKKVFNCFYLYAQKYLENYLNLPTITFYIWGDIKTSLLWNLHVARQGMIARLFNIIKIFRKTKLSNVLWSAPKVLVWNQSLSCLLCNICYVIW